MKRGVKPDKRKDNWVVKLRDVEGMSFREIASKIDEDVKNAHKRYKRAKNKDY